MKQRARKNTTPRVWSATTADTKIITARIPLHLVARLWRMADETGNTVTDLLIMAITRLLNDRGY